MRAVPKYPAERSTQYLTYRPCKRGHKSPRFVANGRCVECHRLYQLAQYEKHRDPNAPPYNRRHPSGLSWNERNKDKMNFYEKNRAYQVRTSGKLSVDIIKNLLASQDGKCVYCKIDITKKPTIDHILPIDKGGLNIDENVQLLCHSCNCKKWTFTHEEYLMRIS
jgi:5-methylcytosine-specific restriction endonuclease McrA